MIDDEPDLKPLAVYVADVRAAKRRVEEAKASKGRAEKALSDAESAVEAAEQSLGLFMVCVLSV